MATSLCAFCGGCGGGCGYHQAHGVLLCRFDVPQWEHVIYQMGDGAPVSRVFKAGECVFNASTK